MVRTEKDKLVGLFIAEKMISEALETKLRNAIAAGGQYDNPDEYVALTLAQEAVFDVITETIERNSPNIEHESPDYARIVKEINRHLCNLTDIMTEVESCET